VLTFLCLLADQSEQVSFRNVRLSMDRGWKPRPHNVPAHESDKAAAGSADFRRRGLKHIQKFPVNSQSSTQKIMTDHLPGKVQQTFREHLEEIGEPEDP
jgi:hypothetical protein